MSVTAPGLEQRRASQRSIDDMLPVEIIADIFVLCLPEDPLRHFQPDLSRAPLLLCHVCSVWRTISLNTPQLWNNFHHRLPIPRVSRSNTLWGILPSSLDFMEWWSSNVRGRSLSLRLALKWVVSNPGWPKNDPNRSIAFLFSMLNSVQFLEIEESYALLLEEIQLSPSQYPNLESVVIREDPGEKKYAPWGTSLWGVSPQDFSFIRAPSLNKLAIKRHYFVLSAVHFVPSAVHLGQDLFSPDRLTHLFVNLSLLVPEWEDFISKCAKLEYARIHLKLQEVFSEDYAPATSTTKRVVPRLRQLIIDCPSHQLVHAFDKLSFPSLYSLHLVTESSYLHTASLPYLSTSDLAHMLIATPSLRVLDISTPFPCKWLSQDLHGYVAFPQSVPNYERLGNCAPLLEVLVLHLDKFRRGNREMPSIEYISEMQSSGWLDAVRKNSTVPPPEKMRVVLVVDFPKIILDRLKIGEWEFEGVDISAVSRRDFLVSGISQKAPSGDRWFEEARCEKLI